MWEQREGSGARKHLGAVQDLAKAQELDKVRDELLPDLLHEADSGVKPIEPVRFQPVKSPGLYEAEFAMKDGALIFHVWPWGYHEAQRLEQREPTFKADFEQTLRAALATNFRPTQSEFSFDGDMGAWFVKVVGYAESQYWFEHAVQCLETLHAAMGGIPGPRQS